LRDIHDRMIVVVCKCGCRVNENKPVDANSEVNDMVDSTFKAYSLSRIPRGKIREDKTIRTVPYKGSKASSMALHTCGERSVSGIVQNTPDCTNGPSWRNKEDHMNAGI
jgi:hypothetical protein